jgi:branched-chain amino acid aminotransferase
MKAYRAPSGDVQLFRPHKNAERINSSADRMCMPFMDTELFVSAIKALVDLERDWIPEKKGTRLYIRPVMFSTDPFLDVRASDSYTFIIICSPVGPYYNTPGGGIVPTKISVEEGYVRAVVGGVGAAKTGGNYAASLKAQRLAVEKGCNQVLWLDAIEHRYVEEIGTSNAFFVIDDEVITPPLTGTILPGVTRDSVIAMLKKWGVKVSERKLRFSEVVQAAEEGRLKEAFGTGTAAVIAPVGTFVFKDESITVGNGEAGELALKLYNTLYGIQSGTVQDDMGWIEQV